MALEGTLKDFSLADIFQLIGLQKKTGVLRLSNESDEVVIAFKDGMRKASPVLLEPMMAVEVETPEDFMGNVVGDLSGRRGMIQGMEDVVGVKVIKAEVPLSEMFGYSTTLRSLSQGRATYTMEFKHYTEAPKTVAEAVINKKT